MGGLSRIQPQVHKVMSGHDMLICLGADVLRMSVYDPIEPLPEGMPVLQIGLNDWEMGKNYPAEIALRSDLRATLEALIPVLTARGGANLAAAAETRLAGLRDSNWSAKRAKLLDRLEAGEAGSPMNPELGHGPTGASPAGERNRRRRGHNHGALAQQPAGLHRPP